jgi:hypothetical protein
MLAKPNLAEIRGAQMFLRVLGADWHDPYMVKAVIAWFRQESGGVSKVIQNNPFNIRPGIASSYANGVWRGRVGLFLSFSTLTRGFAAAALVLKTLAPRYGYGTVIKAAQSGNALRFLAALALSSWDGSHYGTTSKASAYTTKNHLIVVYKQLPMPVGNYLRIVG